VNSAGDENGPIAADGGSSLIQLQEGQAPVATATARTAVQELALVADIGGTNARFALVPIDGPGAAIEPRSWRVDDFPNLADAARAYLDDAAPRSRVRAGMVAVAAPANRDEVKVTNCNWQFSIERTRRDLGLDELFVINDFAANSWGVVDLPPGGFTHIGNPVSDGAREGMQAVVGPGTGLGVSAISLAGGGISVYSSEGGHVDFAPVTDQESAILEWLRQRHHRVSYERLICGAGLLNIFQAIGGDESVATPEQVTARKAKDPVAAEAVRIFCDVLGSFAGNVALMFGAWQGIYLAGGMLPPIREELLAGGFRRRFDDKGRFGPELERIPVILVEEPALGLLGAAAALRYRLGSA
jgi:glucokinase